MERRYGRANERYRARISNRQKKPPIRINLKGQTFLCIILLVCGMVVSFMGKNESVSKQVTYILYHTNTFSDWKETFLPAAKAVKKGSFKAVAVWTDTINECEKKLGLNSGSKNSTPVNAKAQKEVNADKGKKKSEDLLDKETSKDKTMKDESNDDKNEHLTFRAPVSGEISSVFGERVHPVSGENAVHTGVDIAAAYGDAVVSAAPGVVTSAGTDSANGSYVVVKHNDSLSTVYAHLSKISVSSGEKVDLNTKIGEVGSSGISTGPHLHFEVKLNSESVNPENYITIKHRS